MANDTRYESIERAGWLGSCLLWFFWGGSMSFMAILSLVLTVLLAASVSLNVYLGWKLAGLEVAVTRSGAVPIESSLPLPTSVLGIIPTNTPVVEEVAPELPDSSTPAPPAIELSPLEVQFATLAALATEVAAAPDDSGAALALPPTATATPLPPDAPAAVEAPPTEVPSPTAIPPAEPLSTPGAGEVVPAQPEGSGSEPADLTRSEQALLTAATEEPLAPLESSNTYELIPINGERESRPAEEHGDLNLKLRQPERIEVDLALRDIANAGSDSNAPNLGAVFNPEFVNAYTVHNWDWECNCVGDLLQEDQLVLVGIKTTPGEPVFIPTKEQDIFQGKFYATLLYASEDSVTFVYEREGNVATGYSVHYIGLRTDPNLLKLYRESKGNELPGLTLDTPIGVATDELIVAIRDKGKFMDARSLKDWWD